MEYILKVYEKSIESNNNYNYTFLDHMNIYLNIQVYYDILNSLSEREILIIYNIIFIKYKIIYKNMVYKFY